MRSDICSRPDLSTFLVHLTRGTDDEAAFQKLKSIIKSKQLNQSAYKVGNEHVVCFTETPVGCLKTAGGLKNYTDFSNYSCFGIMVNKKDVYESGGRPVLYLEQQYLEELPTEIKWRHQIFEPSFTTVKYDWTWEREWRKKASYNFHGLYYEAIVPTAEYADRLRKELDDDQVRIYEDCTNSQVGNLNYDELCNPNCELEISNPCPEPEDFDKKVICLDGTC